MYFILRWRKRDRENKLRVMKMDRDAIFSVYNAAVITITSDTKVTVHHSQYNTRTQSEQ